MFSDDEEGADLSDLTAGTESEIARVQGETCRACGETEGSMLKNREVEEVLCKDCWNDPEVEWDG